MIFVGDIYSLINYIMFVDSVFLLFTVGGMLWLRRKKPDLNRPIKVFFLIFKVNSSGRSLIGILFYT